MSPSHFGPGVHGQMSAMASLLSLSKRRSPMPASFSERDLSAWMPEVARRSELAFRLIWSESSTARLNLR